MIHKTILIFIGLSCYSFLTDHIKTVKFTGSTSISIDERKMKLGVNSGFYSPLQGEQPFRQDYKTGSWKPGDDPWNPQFRDNFSIFTNIRFHQWHRVSFSNDTHWSDRPSAEVDYPTTSGGGIRMPYEWEIRMCNDFEADYWLNCPALATDEYMEKLAELVKNHLDPDLKVYIEWSNEVWNPDYAENARWDPDNKYNGQYTIAVDRGRKMGFAEEEWEAAALYSVHAHVRLWHAFSKVFGNETSSRVVKVMPGMLQNDSFELGEYHMRGLRDPLINIHDLHPDVYAVNGFIGNGLDGSSETIIQDLMGRARDVSKAYQLVRMGLDKAGYKDITIAVYEGGQHVVKNSHILNVKPEMYDIYMELLNNSNPYVEVFNHYRASSHFSPGNSFGMKEYTEQPIEIAHKYRALYDWAQ